MYLSSPASQEVQSLRGYNYFLLLKGGCVGMGSRLIHPRNSDCDCVHLPVFLQGHIIIQYLSFIEREIIMKKHIGIFIDNSNLF